MALPRPDWPALVRLTTMSIAPNDPDYALEAGPEATLEVAHRELFAYFYDAVTQRRRASGDDLISTMLTMDVGGRTPGTGAASSCSPIRPTAPALARPSRAALTSWPTRSPPSWTGSRGTEGCPA